MNAVVFYNIDSNSAKKIADDICLKSAAAGINCLLADNNFNGYANIDFVVAVGGDGTIIHHAKKAAIHKKPILGVNAGRVGYLADLEPGDIDKIALLADGNMQLEKRMIIKAELVLPDKTVTEYCLNDAVVSKGALSQIIDITAAVSGEILSYRADGLIACTPTGSTAYSMSAGGPLVDPNIDVIMLTPICSRTFHSRPLLLNGNSSVVIRASRKNADVFVTVDGEKSYKMDQNSYLRISKAEFDAQFVRINNNSFCSTVSKKLFDKQ